MKRTNKKKTKKSRPKRAFSYFMNGFTILLFIIFLAILTTMSRMTYLGFTALIIAYAVFEAGKSKKILAAAVILLIFFLLSPFYSTTLQILPFVGEEAQSTVEGRINIIDPALSLIGKNPLFGDPNFLESQEMNSIGINMEGDVVNTYLLIGMKYGLIGLILFLLIFIDLFKNLIKVVATVKNSYYRMISKGLIATLIAVMVMISAMSFITYITTYTWILFGIYSGFIHYARKK
ncbi:hypothetical protein GF361_00050 [Candidatus Woesearchaeota archaeon]|nr:hypothetical protein [Candidatus Woesearchaeota archaeon]